MIKDFPFKTGNKGRMSTLSSPIQHCARNPRQAIRREKEIKGVKIEN